MPRGVVQREGGKLIRLCRQYSEREVSVLFSLTDASSLVQTSSLFTSVSSSTFKRNLSSVRLRSGFLGKPSSSSPSRGILYNGLKPDGEHYMYSRLSRV